MAAALAAAGISVAAPASRYGAARDAGTSAGAGAATTTTAVHDTEANELRLFKVSQALLADPQNPELLLQKGAYLSALGQLQAAFEVFELLRQNYPDHPAPYANLAAVYARQGRLEEARQMLMKADSLQANKFQTQVSLASVHLGLALDALHKANKINPDDAPTQNKLKLLEKYLADTNRTSFPSVARAAAASRPAARDSLEEATPARQPAKLPADRPPARSGDRLQLGMLDGTGVGAGAGAARSASGVPDDASSALAIRGTADPRKAEVAKVVEAWGIAWAARSYPDYAAQYSRNFRPAEGLARETWAQRKQALMEKAQYIRVDHRILGIQFSGATAVVRLRQRYQSDTLADAGLKELTLGQEDGRWKILSERQVR